MLDPYLIEKIKQQEEAKRREADRPRLQLPIPEQPPEDDQEVSHEEDPGRGVIIIDYGCTD